MDKIYALYIDDNGNRRINITPQEKSLIEQSKRNKNITVFDNVYKMKFDELKAQLSAFLKNLKDPNEYKELLKKRERPYTLQDDWSILWITDEYDDDENGRGRAPTVDVPLISSKKKEAARIDVKALEEQLSNDEEEKEEKKEEEEGDGDIAEPAGSTQVTSIPSSSGAYNDTPAGDVEMTSTPAGITKTGGSVDVENIINEDKPAGNAGQGVTVVDFSAFDDD
mmetsp:Transcript_55624/g.50073  ORF Transcript_55624/g.50073 Transcript_55624/m.50073 type:complete len:224 (-) Transcript_55624:55-726(-)